MASLPTHRAFAALAAGLLCATAAMPARAQRLPPDVLALYGGIWSADCANPAAPRLRVEADGLLVERDGQRLTGSRPQATASYFGNSPPRNYEIALMSEVRGGSELLFIIYHDTRGRFIEINAGPKTAAALGPRLQALHYRACNPAAEQMKAATPPPPAPPAAAAGGSVDVAIASPRFSAIWRRALGPDAREPWLAQMNGPAPPPRWVNVAGSRYAFNAFCKDHDCFDNNAVQLYAPETGVVFALVHRLSRDTLVGNPPPVVATELRRLWKAQWRQQSR
ncbi:Ivy family c-type lysozyme inhibitor [Variovorax humicola]|uniref:Ivy family c-type lysozyme inhibitor n=1 Tax=Variovorax humicola TaxID=1769758 RepID=A0ABU8VYR7_9BURK